MATYKAVDTEQLETELTEVANAIREKTGGTEKMTIPEMAQAVKGLSSLIVASASGNPIVLSDSTDLRVQSLRLFGKTTQNGTPTPEAPVPLVSAGDGGSLGVTVAGKNLFHHIPFAEMTYGEIPNASFVELVGNDGVILQGAVGSEPGREWHSNGFYRPGFHSSSKTKKVKLRKGDVVTVTADYTMLENVYSASPNIAMHLIDPNGGIAFSTVKTVSVGVKTRLTMSGTVPVDDEYMPSISLNSGKVRIENIQMEYGSSATEYEPYKEPQTLTLSNPNGLPGIPVTTDGNYTDETGQQWVCDEVDFGRGVYVQRVGKEVFDGSSDENWGANTTNTSGKYRYVTSKIKGLIAPPLANNKKVNARTSAFITAIAATGGTYSCTQGFSADTSGSVQCYSDLHNTYSLSVWTSYLSANPMTVIYELATPIETPLSAEELAAYAALHTNYPNTTILNDGGAGMEVSYVADTKLYIDNQVAALANAMLNQ